MLWLKQRITDSQVWWALSDVFRKWLGRDHKHLNRVLLCMLSIFLDISNNWIQGPYTSSKANAKETTLSVKLSDFTVWPHSWWKNWVNCAVLTGISARLRTVLSSRLSCKELRSSLRESHSFLCLPADITMASSQGTSVSSNSFNRWASHDIFLFKYHFLLYILRFLFFFSDNIMADVASKQQTTALFLSTIVTRTRREMTKKIDKLDGKPVLCQRIFSSVFRAVFLHS